MKKTEQESLGLATESTRPQETKEPYDLSVDFILKVADATLYSDSQGNTYIRPRAKFIVTNGT